MFQLITPAHQKVITKLVESVSTVEVLTIVENLENIIEQIRTDIPVRKRISYGRYSIIKEMGLTMYPLLVKAEINVFDFAAKIFNDPDHYQFVRSLAVQLISIYGLETKELAKILPVFEAAAANEHWELRECSVGFAGKLTHRYPREMQKWYLKMARSENPLQRRFASESLRPVADNRWLKKQPEFALSIIKHLFKESRAYPRTSVGNNLSDWMRIDKERTIKLVKKLAQNGNKDSHWIAYRACRNLVKKEPVRVMDLLDVDEYKYKDRIYFREDY